MVSEEGQSLQIPERFESLGGLFQFQKPHNENAEQATSSPERSLSHFGPWTLGLGLPPPLVPRTGDWQGTIMAGKVWAVLM